MPVCWTLIAATGQRIAVWYLQVGAAFPPFSQQSRLWSDDEVQQRLLLLVIDWDGSKASMLVCIVVGLSACLSL